MTAALPLNDKIALVTGASRGIGRASALALADAGAHIVATARTQGALESLDDEIFARTGRRATLVPLDLAEPAGLDTLGYALHQRFGRLDILLHAGGVLGAMTPVSHVEPGLWDRVMLVNATASWRLIAMRTRMRAEAYPGEDPSTLPDPTEIGPMVVELVLSDPGQPTGVRSFRAWKADREAPATSA